MAGLDPAVRPLDPSLDALRREIDSIDDTALDLLIRRADIALEVAKAKARQGGAPLFRAGREAEILRRLIGRTRRPLAAALVYRVWRDIIVASTCVQGPFGVAVCAKAGGCMALAREHFGDSVLSPLASVAAVLSAVARGRSTLGLLPMPGAKADRQWWRMLPPGVTILSGLPFLTTSDRRRGGERAMIVGRQEFEPSGDDIFFLKVQSGRRHASPLGLKSSSVIASLRRGRTWLQLVETALPFEEAARLGTGGAVRLLGGYARPIVLSTVSKARP